MMDDVQVTRTMYDASHAKQACLRSTACTLNLTYNADDDVIVQFASPLIASPGFVTFFTSECALRKTFWLGVFIIPPSSETLFFYFEDLKP
jgi:hypothetical protein